MTWQSNKIARCERSLRKWGNRIIYSMKFTLFVLLLISPCLWAEDEAEAEESAESENTPAEHEPSENENKAAELILKGDASALKGERENALSLWGQAFGLVPSNVEPGQVALDRLTWACPREGAGGWGSKSAGRDFALHMRDYYLGSVHSYRQALIRDYCQDPDNSEPHEQIEAYLDWLQQMMPEDRNLNLLTLILEDGMGQDTRVLSNILSYVFNGEALSDAPRTFKMMKTLGFLGNADNFTPLGISVDDGGQNTLMGRMMASLRNADNQKQRASLVALKKLLRQVQPRTIGVDLTLAMLDSDNAKALASFLTRHKAELEVIKPNRRNNVLDVLKTHLAGYPNTENMDDAIVALLRPLLPDGELKAHKLDDLLAEALSPEKVVLDESGEFPAAITAAALITKAAQNHPDKAASGFKVALQLLQKCPAQNDPDTSPWKKPTAELIKSLIGKSSMFSMALKATIDAGILNDPESSDWIFRSVRKYFANRQGSIKPGKLSGQQIVDCFFSGDSVFLGEAESFQPVLPARTKVWSGTILGHLVRLINKNDSKPGQHLKKDVIQILGERKPRTFGLEMIEVMLAKDEKETIKFIRRRATDFSRIPPDRRPAVLSALSDAWEALTKPEKLDPEIRKLLQPLLTSGPVEKERLLH